MSAKTDLRSEDEANLFALALLMPHQFILAEIAEHGPIDLNNEKRVAKACARFQVSPAMFGYRIGLLKGGVI